jgi:hypothetical protein
MEQKNYFVSESTLLALREKDVVVTRNFMKAEDLHQFKEEIIRRPKKTELPKKINHFASFSWDYLIDFRSFRDLQRQRSALQTMPLLTTEHGFEKWYIEQLPQALQEEAAALLSFVEKESVEITNDSVARQYLIPMGYKVATRFTVSISDVVYIIELRTGETVHPTVRTVMQEIYRQTEQLLPDWFKMYANMEPDTLSIKRGGQTIFIDGKDVSKG